MYYYVMMSLLLYAHVMTKTNNNNSSIKYKKKTFIHSIIFDLYVKFVRKLIIFRRHYFLTDYNFFINYFYIRFK